MVCEECGCVRAERRRSGILCVSCLMKIGKFELLGRAVVPGEYVAVSCGAEGDNSSHRRYWLDRDFVQLGW